MLLRSNFITECCVNCSFSDNLAPLGVPFILLAMVHGVYEACCCKKCFHCTHLNSISKTIFFSVRTTGALPPRGVGPPSFSWREFLRGVFGGGAARGAAHVEGPRQQANNGLQWQVRGTRGTVLGRPQELATSFVHPILSSK